MKIKPNKNEDKEDNASFQAEQKDLNNKENKRFYLGIIII